LSRDTTRTGDSAPAPGIHSTVSDSRAGGEDAGQLVRRARRIHISHRDHDRAHAADRRGVPGADVPGPDRREGFGQPAHRQAIPAVPEGGGERELEGIAEHVVGHPLGLGDHQPPLGRDVGVAQVRLGEDGFQQRRRLGQVLRQHRGAEAEPIGGRAGGECPSQALEREGEGGRVQIAGAAHRRTHQERAEPGLGRRVESPAGDVNPEVDQRHAGLPVDQQIGAGQAGDPDAVLLRGARRYRRPPRRPRGDAVRRGAQLGDREGAGQGVGGEIASAARRQVHDPGHRVRNQVPRRGFPHLGRSDLGEERVFPVEQPDVVQRLGRRERAGPALHGLEPARPSRADQRTGPIQLFGGGAHQGQPGDRFRHTGQRRLEPLRPELRAHAEDAELGGRVVVRGHPGHDARLAQCSVEPAPPPRAKHRGREVQRSRVGM
jgi:hypothetical protein